MGKFSFLSSLFGRLLNSINQKITQWLEGWCRGNYCSLLRAASVELRLSQIFMYGTLIKGAWSWYNQMMAGKAEPFTFWQQSFILYQTTRVNQSKWKYTRGWWHRTTTKSDDRVLDVSENVLWPQWWYRTRRRLPPPPHSLELLWTEPSLEPHKCCAFFLQCKAGCTGESQA